jgi:hypothetical protein
MCTHGVVFGVDKWPYGQAHGLITHSMGLRQGDPLSSYFLILCTEGLSHMLRRVEMEKLIMGLPITRGGLRPNHLFFVDDSLFFCRANLDEWNKMQEILEMYERSSEHRLNREKKSFFFFFQQEYQDVVFC